MSRLPRLRLRAPRMPRLHLPTLVGRVRTDRGPLLLAGLVVALATLLAETVPLSISHAADEAVHDAVATGGADAAITVNVPFAPSEDPSQPRERLPETPVLVEDAARNALFAFPDDLAAKMRPPVASMTSETLKVYQHGPGRTLQLGYVVGTTTPEVEWVDGAAPAASSPDPHVVVPLEADPWPVQVGLSEQTAKELGAGPGDRIETTDRDNTPVDVRVSGVFRPHDPADARWQMLPTLLAPHQAPDGITTLTEMGGLLSKDSVPDARLALEEGRVTRTVSFIPEPSRIGSKEAAELATAVVALKAAANAPVASEFGPVFGEAPPPVWTTFLDRVLRDVRGQIRTATGQASVLLAGLTVALGLVLVLAADLLTRRRSVALAGARIRGASLARVGAELLVESLAVALLGGAAGLVLGHRLVDGWSWRWSVPVVLVAALAGPVLGVREAARATGGRQAPANRSARRWAARTRQLRTLAVELALVAVAVASFVTLRQRGISPEDSGDAGAGLLPALAPTLVVGTGALVLLHVLPVLARFAVGRATRARSSLPLFAAARAVTSAARPLPFLVLTLSTALLSLGLILTATERDGEADGAWRQVGADARITTDASASLPRLAGRIAAQPGVRRAVAGRLADNVRVQVGAATGSARLLVVDSAAYEALLADTPLPQAPQLALLRRSTTGSPPPALLRTSDPALLGGTGLTIRWEGAIVALTRVAVAPALGDGREDVVVVDAAAFAIAGAVAEPDTVWATGPGAAAALTAVSGTDGSVLVRAEVLHDRRSAPLSHGLLRLAYASAGVLLVLGLLGIVLGASASGPARAQTLARLRTLGLRPSEARRVIVGELVPPVLVAGAGGLALGVLVARACLGPLALRLRTGQVVDPALVVPWIVVVPVIVLLAAVVLVGEFESSVRRRERLGQVLRVGG